MKENLNITNEWDKVFPLSEKVNHKKVTFTNHFGITLVADLYEPKEYEGKLPALAVSAPYGVPLKNNQVDYMLKRWLKEDF